MPYCPKCDMEFVEGVTVCTDCGGTLLASREEALALKQKEEEALALKRQEEARLMEEQLSSNPESRHSDGSLPVHTYVKQSQKQEDLKSSAAAFALTGLVLGAAALCLWAGLLPFSISGSSRMLLQILMTLMAVGCLIVTAFSLRSARSAGEKAKEEDRRTEEILRSFTDAYTGEALDLQLAAEAGELSPEELSLKRFELIQDLLITAHDLPDPAYVDALSEELYGRLYQE